MVVCISLTRALKNALLATDGDLPEKGIKDPQVIALIDDVRGAIIHHANPTWLSHSPVICEGMEDYIREITALREKERVPSDSAQQSTVATQAPPPVPVTVPLPEILSLDRDDAPSSGARISHISNPPRQIASMPVRVQHSPLQLTPASLPHSPTAASLLFRSQSTSPASSAGNVQDALTRERSVRSSKHATNAPEVS